MDKGDSGRSSRLFAKFKSAVTRDTGSDTTEGTNESNTEPISERRREQIRRAQRLHRQRKAEHSKRLTAEISDLRAKDASKTSRIEHLEKTVAFLSNLLTMNGIYHEIQPWNETAHTLAQVTVLDDPTNNNTTTQLKPQAIQVTLPGGTHVLAPTSNNNNDNNSGNNNDNDHLNLSALDPQTNLSAIDLSSTQLGIDFVLTLEHPCLYHHHGPAENDDDLLSHSAMMQAPIMARAPDLVTGNSPGNNNNNNPETPRLPPTATWSVPGDELERLLAFSNELRLPAEITPVQVWSLIRQRAQMGWMPSQAVLVGLLDALARMVTCYGFGAVIEKTAFERLLQQYSQQL